MCYPCYWGAKLEYENGITDVNQIPAEMANGLGDLFTKSGYSWPFDLIEAWKQRHYDKADTELRRWWSPKCKALRATNMVIECPEVDINEAIKLA